HRHPVFEEAGQAGDVAVVIDGPLAGSRNVVDEHGDDSAEDLNVDRVVGHGAAGDRNVGDGAVVIDRHIAGGGSRVDAVENQHTLQGPGASALDEDAAGQIRFESPDAVAVDPVAAAPGRAAGGDGNRHALLDEGERAIDAAVDIDRSSLRRQAGR